MFHIYNENAPKSDIQINVWNMKANPKYLAHLDNLLILHVIANESTDFRERQQAEKEIKIAMRKMTFWERHPNFVREEVLPEIEKKISDWRGRISTSLSKRLLAR